MYHRGRKKMRPLIIVAVLLLSYPTYTLHKTIAIHKPQADRLAEDHIDNSIIDFEEDYTVKFNKKYNVPWNPDDYFNKESHRYTIIKDNDKKLVVKGKNQTKLVDEVTSTVDYSVIPLELISTTENVLSAVDSTIENDLTVIPLATTRRSPKIVIKQTVVLPTSTEEALTTTEFVTEQVETTTKELKLTTEFQTTTNNIDKNIVTTANIIENTQISVTDRYTDTTELELTTNETATTTEVNINVGNQTFIPVNTTKTFKDTNTTLLKLADEEKETNISISKPNSKHEDTHRNISNLYSKDDDINKTVIKFHLRAGDPNRTSYNKTNSKLILDDNDSYKGHPKISLNNLNNIKNVSKVNIDNGNSNITILSYNSTERENIIRSDTNSTEESDVPIFTELDAEDFPDVPEDYYDSKDVVPTTAPKTDALSVIFGLAGSVVESVVESVAERVVPKSIFDLFKRMQRQNEALEAERLRSREENGGLGQFGRGILKSISSGISRPLSQLMAGVRDIGSLDTDRGFVNSLASGVTSVANVANSVVDAFKDRVQAIYPGTVWCGDGRSATARSSDLGLFFFTDTCCRQHDACKLYIRAGETKYGLTNTGLFTRSHCSCDAKFRDCLQRTNSLVSAQIGLTYFNVLGPQCFRRAHPIVRCVRRTRITGQKCEEYELDYTKPRMWQWFDNETF